jgi:hypothetical protein
VKIWAYVIIVLAVIALIVGAYYVGKKPVNVTTPPPQITHNSITQPIRTTIIRERMPAEIDTVWVSMEPYEIARYSETIDTNRVYVDLDIKYDEKLNEFDVRHNIMAMRDSIYVEKTVDKYIEKKQRFLSGVAQIGVGFKEKQLSTATIDLGVMLGGRYMLSAYGDTDKTIGVRGGVVWP